MILLNLQNYQEQSTSSRWDPPHRCLLILCVSGDLWLKTPISLEIFALKQAHQNYTNTLWSS